MSFGTLSTLLTIEVDPPVTRERLPLLRQMLQNRLDQTVKFDYRGSVLLRDEITNAGFTFFHVEFDETVPAEEITSVNAALANLCGRPESGFGAVRWSNVNNGVDRSLYQGGACYSV